MVAIGPRVLYGRRLLQAIATEMTMHGFTLLNYNGDKTSVYLSRGGLKVRISRHEWKGPLKDTNNVAVSVVLPPRMVRPDMVRRAEEIARDFERERQKRIA